MKYSISLLIICVGIAMVMTPPLDAKERKTKGTVSGAKGRSATYEKTAKRENNSQERNVSRQTEWTNAQGGQGNHTVDRKWNKETGTGTHSSSTTRADGKTASTEATATKTDEGMHIEGTHTGFNGQTSSFEKDITRTGDGSATISSTVTRADGTTVSTTSQATKTENGRTLTGSYESSDGKSGQFNKTVTHEDNTRTVTSEVTNQDGQTATQTAVTTREGNTIEHEASGQRFDGTKWTRSGSGTIQSE